MTGRGSGEGRDSREGGVASEGRVAGAAGGGPGQVESAGLVLGVDWAPAGELDLLVPEVLSRAEIAAGLRIQDPAVRAARLAGRALLLAVAARELGVPPVELPPLTRDCEHCGGPHGRPRVPGSPVSTSLSRASGMVAVGWARTSADTDVSSGTDALVPAPALGLDVVDPGARAPEASVVLHPRERARVAGDRVGALDVDGARLRQAWARKEAVLKSSGHGLVVDPASLDLGLGRRESPLEGPVGSHGGAQRWAPVRTGGWTGIVVTDLRVGPLPGALALAAGWSPPPQVPVRRWPA